MSPQPKQQQVAAAPQPSASLPDLNTAPDPLDLEAFRSNGHALVDWITDYLAGLESRPVREKVAPGEIRAKLANQAPEIAEPFTAMLADLDRVVVPGLAHWQHPGWFAFFPCQSSPPAVLGELAAAGLGVQGMMWATSPAATEIEAQVLDWLVDLLNVPQTWKTTASGGGVIQDSASTATHIAMVVAREACRRRSGASAEEMVAYTSNQAHSSLEKGATLTGFGHMRILDVDSAFAAKPESLVEMIAADRRNGLTPAFLGSTVGTTPTAAVDPLPALGEIARSEQIWHHVDAAYAGSAMICDEFRHLQQGLELADSYTFNPHKWLATNVECSVMWVADRRPLIETLSVMPPYLRNPASDSGQVIDYRDWHAPLGRPFRALKLWFVLRSFGAEGLRQMIRNHVGWARSLAARIDDHPRLECIAGVHFALVTFAHSDGNAATDALAEAVNADGRFYVTVSEHEGQRFVRVSVGSTYTKQHHVDQLWAVIADNA